MSWILDNVPWWFWLMLLGGGGGAILAFVPGALALVISVWNMLPRSVKLAIGAIVAIIAAFLSGRNRGSANERQRQKERDAQAVKNRLEVNDEVRKLDPADRDKSLDKWMRD